MNKSNEKLKAMRELFDSLLDDALERNIMKQIIEGKTPDSIIRESLKSHEAK